MLIGPSATPRAARPILSCRALPAKPMKKVAIEVAIIARLNGQRTPKR